MNPPRVFTFGVLNSRGGVRCLVQNPKQNVFLSDPGIPGVRSMGPSLSNINVFLMPSLSRLNPTTPVNATTF